MDLLNVATNKDFLYLTSHEAAPKNRAASAYAPQNK